MREETIMLPEGTFRGKRNAGTTHIVWEYGICLRINKEVRRMEDKAVNVEQELKEIHADVRVIAEKKPEMVPILIGVIKGIRVTTEAAGAPKVTA